MDLTKNNSTAISFNEIIDLVQRSNLFNKKGNFVINNPLLKQCYLDTINLPFKLKCYTAKQNICTLENLLNTETKSILRSRNIGVRTLVKSKRIILNYLNVNKIWVVSEKSNERLIDAKNEGYFIGKYFPLLRGTFAMSDVYFDFINREISCVKLPKRIKVYINTKQEKKFINDLLNIDYNELIKEPMIGRKTIEKLQSAVINLLQLKKIIFLNS